ncbi:hypothetical protein ASE40_11565 [Flavobacterium sp. Root935]|nr:hypothetical protein ASE40_11565 [Flavobacterium sp. Root935]
MSLFFWNTKWDFKSLVTIRNPTFFVLIVAAKHKMFFLSNLCAFVPLPFCPSLLFAPQKKEVFLRLVNATKLKPKIK